MVERKSTKIEILCKPSTKRKWYEIYHSVKRFFPEKTAEDILLEMIQLYERKIKEMKPIRNYNGGYLDL